MPIFSPRRYQLPFLPHTPDSLPVRLFAGLEYTAKDLLFGCRMCGNCLLQETAFICPMECPKGERNGPCGGSREGRCEVGSEIPCAWAKIYARLEKQNRLHLMDEFRIPRDWRKAGFRGPRERRRTGIA